MNGNTVTTGCLLLAVVLSGACASTQAYSGSAASIQLRERVNGVGAGEKFGFARRVNKVVSVDNPYDRSVRAEVNCGWDARWDLVIEARTTHRILLQPQRARAYHQSCYLAAWSFTDAARSHR